MKAIIFIVPAIFVFILTSTGQQGFSQNDTIRTALENDKLKVIEFVSNPGKDACGKGMHSHVPHLTVFLTDASIRLTTPEGKVQDFLLKKGFVLWSDAETHMAANNGTEPVRVYLVELK